MLWTSALAIYVIIWFFCLFLVLPFHARAGEGDTAPIVAGAEPGAPVRFRPGRAAVQVTLLAAIIFGLYYANYVGEFLTAKDLNFFQQQAR